MWNLALECARSQQIWALKAKIFLHRGLTPRPPQLAVFFPLADYSTYSWKALYTCTVHTAGPCYIKLHDLVWSNYNTFETYLRHTYTRA